MMKNFSMLKVSAAVLVCVFSLATVLPVGAQSRKRELAASTAGTAVRPVIGVSSKAESGSAAATLTYIKSIKKAGGVPLVIPMTTDPEQLEVVLATVDAVVLTGGEDVDPLKYFNEEPHPNLGTVVPERDAFDVLLARMAVEKGVPLLGICRGEQVLNIAFGGSLYQDIPTQVPGTYVKHNQKAPGSYGTHTIGIDKNSLLYKQLKVDTIAVNSFHHQAVKEVAPGFRATAYSKDGVVEAIEKIGSDCVWGVQFHPESHVSGGDNRFLPIFKHLIDCAVRHRENRR